MPPEEEVKQDGIWGNGAESDRRPVEMPLLAGIVVPEGAAADGGGLTDGKATITEGGNATNLSDFVQFGRYSLFIMVLYELLLLPQMGNMTFMVYGGAAPRLLSCGNISLVHFVQSADACAQLRNIQQQWMEEEEGGDGATNGRTTWAPKQCEPLEMDAQFGSIALEFGYFCEQNLHIKKSISVLMFGVLCGSILFGQLSDWFGRKRIMLVAHFGIFLANYAASMAGDLFQFTALQFVAMLFVGGHNTIMHVFLLETMPKRHRVWVMNALSYSPNYVLFAGIAYLASDWRSLLRVLSILNIPAFLGLLLAFESPRWLIHKARLDEAHSVLTRMERINGTATEERMKAIGRMIEAEAKLDRNGTTNYHYFHLFSSWQFCAYTVAISYALLAISVVSYSTVFNLDSLSGSIFLNTALFGLCRYSMNLLVGFVDFFAPKAGRLHIYAGSASLILGTIGTVFTLKLFSIDWPLLMRLSMILAAALCTQLYMLNHVMTTELFPTPIRNTAASFVQIANRIGVVLSPHLFYLALFWSPLPYLLMLVLLAFNLLLHLAIIPETKGRSLSDHMPHGSEQRAFFKKGRSKGRDGEKCELEMLEGLSDGAGRRQMK